MKQLIIRANPSRGEVDIQAGFSLVSRSGSDGGVSLGYYVGVEALFIELFDRILDGVDAKFVAVAEPTLEESAPAWMQRLRNGSVLTVKQAESILRGMLRGSPVGCVMEAGDPLVRISVGFDFELTIDLDESILDFIEGLLPDGLHVALAQEFPDVNLELRVADDEFWSEASSIFRPGKILVIERFAYGGLGESWYWALPGDLDIIREGIAENSLVTLVEFPIFESIIPRSYFDELTIESAGRLEMRYFRFVDNNHNLSVRPFSSAEFLADPELWDSHIWLVPTFMDFKGEILTAVSPAREGESLARWLA